MVNDFLIYFLSSGKLALALILPKSSNAKKTLALGLSKEALQFYSASIYNL